MFTAKSSACNYSFPYALVALALLMPGVAAQPEGVPEAFHQQDWAPASSYEVAGIDPEATLLADIEKGIGPDHRKSVEARLEKAKNGLHPIFQALPKNEYGKLGHSAARYILHRCFVEQHGWYIDGLFSEGDALNSSSPVLALEHRVPLVVQGSFEKRLGGRGFGLHELAVLVAVVETSAHHEAQHQLRTTLQALKLPSTALFNHSAAQQVVDTYMTAFILRLDPTTVSLRQLHNLRTNLASNYPTWPRAQVWLDGVRTKVANGRQMLQRSHLSAIIRVIVDTFGRFHGSQCQGLKQQLTALERKGSEGCVSLADFYAKGLKADSNWLFVESPQYLKHIGVLDETNPADPQLLSANYIASPSNCLQSSSYYLVCCHNECDDILGQLEKQVAAPRATAEDIIASLASRAAAQQAGRVWPTPALRHRLGEVAAYHGGYIPIHGRLFAQWLHHAFPHECPYPYLSGTKNPEWIDEYEEETGASSLFTEKQMQGFVRKASSKGSAKDNDVAASSSQGQGRLRAALKADVGSCAPWQYQEELFAPLPLPKAMSMSELESDPHVWVVASSCALVALVVTLVLHVLRVYRHLRRLHSPKMLQV